jgi:PAS domain S-box-containing protein
MRQDVLHRRSLHHGTWTSSPLPMWIFDQDTFRFLDVNDAALALYGYSRDEMLSMTVADIRPPEDVARFREAAAEDVPGVRRAGVWTHRRKDGALLDVDVTAFHLVIDGRKVVCTMLRDVTHARRVESALAESEDRYRTLFEASPVAMWTWDVESHVFVTANAAACALYGYSRDEFLGMKIEDFALESDREALRERLRRGVGERVVGERTHVTRRGDVIRVQIAAQRVQIDGRTRMFTVVHDVTERRSLEAQLVQAQKMEAIGRMAGGIAHDFNNILAAILVNSDWIATELRESHPLYEDAVGISTAAQRGAALTRQLLTFSRKQPQELRRVELNAVISDTDRLLRRLLGEDVRLKCSLDPTLGPIMADPSQMEQVLLNLAINARDAMPMGGELRVVSRNVELADPRHGLAAGPYVTVSVSDTGCGMDAATQSRIFEPFFTTKEPGKGTGLGLSTVFGIVRQSGGAVVVESEPGRGSTFTVYLPRSESSEPAPRQVLGGRGVAARGRTVLVVEDEEELRKAVCRVLRTEGYGVIAARGAEEGSRILADAERSIDVVLTDVVMPDGNGIALAEQARRVRPTVPILLMSGHSERVVELEGRHSLLAKPFTPKELAAAILEVLEAA